MQPCVARGRCRHKPDFMYTWRAACFPHLGHGDDVGRDAVALEAPVVRPRAPEARLHLIRDAQPARIAHHLRMPISIAFVLVSRRACPQSRASAAGAIIVASRAGTSRGADELACPVPVMLMQKRLLPQGEGSIDDRCNVCLPPRHQPVIPLTEVGMRQACINNRSAGGKCALIPGQQEAG